MRHFCVVGSKTYYNSNTVKNRDKVICRLTVTFIFSKFHLSWEILANIDKYFYNFLYGYIHEISVYKDHHQNNNNNNNIVNGSR